PGSCVDERHEIGLRTFRVHDGQCLRRGSRAATAFQAFQELIIACHTRAGLAGMSRCRMPYAESASTTAFITEVIAPAQPASPQPFTPSGLVVAGTGWLRQPIAAGVSSARGSA